MKEQKQYRAIVVVPDKNDEDWGFYAMSIAYGVLAFRCNEATPAGEYDHLIAPGQWLRVEDVHEEM